MTSRRLRIDRIALHLRGLPVAQAEWLAANLQAALATQMAALPAAASEPEAAGPEETPAAANRMQTSLTGDALAQAVAARLLHLIDGATREPPWH